MSTITSYFSKNFLFDTPIFYKYILQDRYELPSQFLQFVNNDKTENFEGNNNLLKTDLTLKHLNSIYTEGKYIHF
jgi:hypothetical protein